MPRKPTPKTESKTPPMNEGQIAEDFKAADTLSLIVQDAQENVIALARQMGYDGGLSVGALEDGIRFYKQRTAEACLELGKRLLLLKEASLHGEFLPRLELLGIERTSAARLMSVASKFSNAATSQLLIAAHSQSKLIELLVLDNDEILELGEGGTVRGLTVDDIDRMGVRELRATLREARAEKVADDQLIADKSAKIDKLSRRIAKAKPDDVLKQLQQESTSLMNDAVGCVRGGLRQALIALKNHSDDDHTLFMAGLVGQLQADLTALRDEFDLPDVSTAAEKTLAAEVGEWAFPQTARP